MTKDFATRQKAHQVYIYKKTGEIRFPENEYTMYPVMTRLTKDEARVLEQGLISLYVIEYLDNAFNSIAPKNWGDKKFYESIKRLTDLLSSEFDGENL